MIQVGCGCELSPGGDRVLSACSTHAAYVRQHVEAAKHPRADGRHAELREKLIVVLAPVIFGREPLKALDPNTKAEMLQQSIDCILARMD